MYTINPNKSRAVSAPLPIDEAERETPSQTVRAIGRGGPTYKIHV